MKGQWFFIRSYPHEHDPTEHYVEWGVRYSCPSRGLCNKYRMPIGIYRHDHYRAMKVDSWAIYLHDNSRMGPWLERGA